jgi:2-polyprenyl-3-methyl-5-hydroxy-6-metoxy-1,4-benzoquinol methylase
VADEPALTTAHLEWDRRWRDDRARARWRDPAPEVARLVPELRARGARRVLDVGCGIGRHALLFAREGFDVSAVDASPAGIDELRRAAADEGLTVDARVAEFTEVPYDGESFGHVVAWNVLYHGDADVARAAFAECARVLVRRGTFQLTMLSTRHRRYGEGREVRPGTFVVARDHDVDGDKHHPHLYVRAVDLTAMLDAAGFEVQSLVDTDQDPPHEAFHWTVVAQRR